MSAWRKAVRQADVRTGTRVSRALVRHVVCTAIVSALIVGEWAAFGRLPEDAGRTAGAREIKIPAFIFPAPPPADLLLPQEPASRDPKPKGVRAFA